MNLPPDVVNQDRALQKATDDLLELRWHWTLDESNPERVSVTEYARQVGVAHSTVSKQVRGYAAWSPRRDVATTPGQPQTLTDYVELANMAEERQVAVKAVAEVSGSSISNVAAHKREEVDAVLSTARERALDRGTTVAHETQRAADWRAKARRAADAEQDERKARSTARFIEMEGHIGAAMQRLRKVLDAAEGVQFSDEERDLTVTSLAKLRALLGLIDLRIAGETNIDWDTELERLVG